MSDSFEPDFGRIEGAPPTWNAKRPVRIAVLGDFGAGAGRGRLDKGAALAKRKPIAVEFDTLEDAMQRLGVALTLPLGAGGAPVEIELADLDAFHPDAIYASVPLFAELASLRKRLQQGAQFAAAAAEVRAWAKGAGAKASRLAMAASARGSAPATDATLDDFARLTGRASVRAKAAGAADALTRSVVGPFVKASDDPSKDALVAAVDAGLADAMRALLHHPDFQTTESLWRGVDFLLRRIETGPRLQVHLIDVSAEEVAADLGVAGDLGESGLYALLVDQPSQLADGGYAYVAACYEFDATPAHAELLGRLARIASYAGASLVAGIRTDPFADRKEPPAADVRDAFAALRADPAASFLGLVGPRFLLRHPYGKKSDPVDAFAFEEFSREAGLRGMLWGHPALLAVAALAGDGALTVGDLPFHTFVDEHGDSVALPCTERLISTGVASLLREAGINAVMAKKGEPVVRFNGLEAVDGDGLAAPGGAPKKLPKDARFSFQRKPAARRIEDDDEDDAPAPAPAIAERRAATAATSRRAAAEPVLESSAEAEADEDAGAASARARKRRDVDDDDSADDGAEVVEAGDDGSADDDRAAGDGDADGDDENESRDESEGEDESKDESKEPEIDPDLAALLKSLG